MKILFTSLVSPRISRMSIFINGTGKEIGQFLFISALVWPLSAFAVSLCGEMLVKLPAARQKAYERVEGNKLSTENGIRKHQHRNGITVVVRWRALSF